MPPAPDRPRAPLLLLTRPWAESLRLARLLAPAPPPQRDPHTGPHTGAHTGHDANPHPNIHVPGAASGAVPGTVPGAVQNAVQYAAPDAIIVSPILRIVPVDHDPAPLRAAAGLVFTSAHAVPAAGPGAGRPALCVGARTGDAARRAGFAVTEGAGTADSLLPLIAAHGPGLIHPHGRHLAQRLPVPGVVVYDQQALPLTPQAFAALAGARMVVVPVYSPRSAALLGGMAAGARAPLHVVAISPAAARAWAAGGSAPPRMTLAQAPSGAAMVQAIRRALAAEQS